MSKAPTPPAAEETAAAPSGGKKKLLILTIVLLVLLLLIGGGAAAWFFTHQTPAKAANGKTAAVPSEDDSKPPVFVALDPFTVNLAPENGDEKYLQVAITVQVPDDKAADSFKTNMPLVRSRILMLLSSQKASDLLSPNGKDLLIKAITAELSRPFFAGGTPQKIRGVFFTSFIVQ